MSTVELPSIADSFLQVAEELKNRPIAHVDLSFYHGLGDISNFARLIPVYRKYGIDIGVRCSKDKQIVIRAAGGRVISEDQNVREHHKWFIQSGKLDQNPGNDRGWEGNKTGCNMRHYGLEQRANHETLWKDLKEVDISIKPLVEQQDWDIVEHTIENWSRPLVLWHSIGNTNSVQKSFDSKQQQEFTFHLLDQFKGTLLLLDWDSRVTWTPHQRLKHLMPEFGGIGLSRLAALMYRSDLMIGVDSGPYYFSALTDVPSVGVFFSNIHPAEYIIPTKRSMTITMGSRSQTLDRSKRFEFQICDTDGSMKDVAEWCTKMLQPRRYLPDKQNCSKAADVQLQRVVQRCRGISRTGISAIYDRQHSFDILLQECKKRELKNFVETGCIRADEDWGGAGFSTALFGRYCQLVGGHLTSFDLDERNCKYARSWCRQFAESVEIIQSRGDDGIRGYKEKIDVLYLDSLDTEHAGHQEENLKEFKAAEPKLHGNSVVIIDDTPSSTIGKGCLTVKYMLENGWRLLYGGYQVVLVKV